MPMPKRPLKKPTSEGPVVQVRRKKKLVHAPTKSVERTRITSAKTIRPVLVAVVLFEAVELRQIAVIFECGLTEAQKVHLQKNLDEKMGGEVRGFRWRKGHGPYKSCDILAMNVMLGGNRRFDGEGCVLISAKSDVATHMQQIVSQMT